MKNDSRKDRPSQINRFREAARELGADVPEERFDRALKAVASKREVRHAGADKPVSGKGRKGSTKKGTKSGSP